MRLSCGINNEEVEDPCGVKQQENGRTFHPEFSLPRKRLP